MTDKTKKPAQPSGTVDQNSNEAGRETLQGRRRILKSLAIGGGVAATGKVVPEEWKKPLVETVVIPGHALGSSPAGSIFRTSNDVVITSTDPDGPSSFDPLELLVPSANADTINGCTAYSNAVSAMYDITFAFNPNNSVDICVEVDSPALSTADQASSTLKNDGTLNDVNILSHNILLQNMSFDPGSFVVNGTINFDDTALDCAPTAFSAPLVPGPFLCPVNVTIMMDWSDPYEDKPKPV